MGIQGAEPFQKPGCLGVSRVACQPEPALAGGDGAFEGEGDGVGQVRFSDSKEPAEIECSVGTLLGEQLQLFRFGECECCPLQVCSVDR